MVLILLFNWFIGPLATELDPVGHDPHCISNKVSLPVLAQADCSLWAATWIVHLMDNFFCPSFAAG